MPHLAPLARAARFDGVVLTAMTQEGEVEPLNAAYVETAMDEISRLRSGLGHFDVAIVTHGLPDPERVEGYTDMGVTWMLVTGWIAQLQDLVVQDPHILPV